MAIGMEYVVAEVFTLPLGLVAVMVSGQLVVALKVEMVALVEVKLVTVGELPVTKKVKATLAPTPPDQVTLNEEAVQAEKVMPLMAVGSA